MLIKLLKAFGISAAILFMLFGAIEFWVFKHKEEIFRKIQEVANEKLQGNLEIGDCRFRPFSGGLGLNFTLSNITLTDSLFQQHQTPFLKSEYIHVELNLNSIFSGKIKVKNLVLQNGQMIVFKNIHGYSNLSIFEKFSQNKTSNSDLEDKVTQLNRFRFINFKVSYYDSLTTKRFGGTLHDVTSLLNDSNGDAKVDFQGNVFFQGLFFKPDKGGFLINQETKLHLKLAFHNDTFTILPSSLETAKQNLILIDGHIDLADSTKNFNLNFESKKIKVDDALQLLTKTIQTQIDSIGIKTQVDAKVALQGTFGPGLPRADVQFSTSNFDFKLPIGVIKNVRADGKFTNQADVALKPSPENSMLTSNTVNGQFESLPFNIQLIVKDFVNPHAKLDGHFTAESVNNWNDLLDSKRYKINGGKADIEFHFNGLLKSFFDPKEEKFNGTLSGKASIKDLSVDYLPRDVHLSKITGDFIFNESALVFSNLSFHDGQNDLFLKGKLIDLLPYLFGSSRPLQAMVDINIPTWKLTWIEALLNSNRNARPKRRKKVALSDVLEDVIDNVTISARLRANQLSYKRFKARNVKGDFVIKDNNISIKNFEMNAFGKGRFEISGDLENSGKNTKPKVKIKGNLINANVSNVFHSFNNFGQQTVTGHNLFGNLTSDFQFESLLNNNAKLVTTSMNGFVGISLKNGRLINFEPFLKMKRLIFKKRNFEDVRFAPIVGKFSIQGQQILVKPMEVESNIMTLFIDGIYSFGNKTNLNLQIPLSNLKKRDSTYVLNPNDPANKQGSNVYLRAEDDGNGEVNIKLAFRKKKDK